MAHGTAHDLRRRRLLFGGPAAPAESPPSPVAIIAASCLAFRGVACMACRDACPAGAIRFALAFGGARPRVEVEACTGCAECAPVCPVGSIAMDARPEKEARSA